MTDKKTLKRAVKAVWDKVKAARVDRAKLYGATDIAISADQLGQLAGELRDLSKQLSALDAMPPDAIPATIGKQKRARKSRK